MDTSRLKKFAQYARRSLIEQVESKLKLVLGEESEARREYPEAVAELEQKLKEQGKGEETKQQLIEQVAYIWFNRFCALRFMDVNQYNRIMVISPLSGQFQPEILAEAKAGHIDDGIVNEATREKVFGLLGGSIASRDGQSEAFRLLIVAVCNDLHRIMPYLFERIEDYTELLMPDDLLSGNSILAYTREAMTPEACESVESIGWLYQFYISEKKDQVFDDLKKNKKITPENIPAATQLFTPHWIVRYLVENSLGRLWMLNNPSSKVIEQMDYYIKPVEIDSDYPKISSPEDIKVCDPACGSGHMLTYAYDLLYSIYLDAGYDSTVIPEKILANNLYGIEIDERAAELAAFALTMKAIKGNPLGGSNNRRRFFRNPVEPNICRLDNVIISDQEIDDYIDFSGTDLFTKDLRQTLQEFESADNFGSLIRPVLKTPKDALVALEAKDVSGQLFLMETHKSALKVLRQADYLSQKYHVVVANPPYMGSKGMNVNLSKWAKCYYPESKADLFSMFIERNLNMVVKSGFSAMINMQSWMFLSSFEKLRLKIFESAVITSMAHLGTRAFDSIGGEVVSTTAYVLQNISKMTSKGSYVRLVDGRSEAEKETALLDCIKGIDSHRLHYSSPEDFYVVPGSPVAYWLSDAVKASFVDNPPIKNDTKICRGISTGDNERFSRLRQEVSRSSLDTICISREAAAETGKRWFPYNRGGSFRKWSGLGEDIIDYQNNGERMLLASEKGETPGFRHDGAKSYFKPLITWAALTSGVPSFRFLDGGYVLGHKGPGLDCDPESIDDYLALLNCKVISYFLSFLSPTLDINIAQVASLPQPSGDSFNIVRENTESLIRIAKSDWDDRENSWGFTRLALLCGHDRSELIEQAYADLRESWIGACEKVKKLEEENNRAFIEYFKLTAELTPEVPYEEITLTSNPVYRYGKKTSEKQRESRLLKETIVEFLQYSVGCMFGRYSLEKEGLILADQGDTLESYLDQIPSPSFEPDYDNVIPLIDFDGDWFEDDITERFKKFLKVTFGDDNFAKNLAFIEEALGAEGKRKDIKTFFLKDFYTDHVKRYKKRPIYWMFSSPKGSFNALIYMHRYRPDTVSVVLNDYLREFRTKLQARKESHEQIEISASASQKEKTQAIKAIQKINKVLDEINDYEHDTLYPLAGKPPEIDLDDGVKHNYPLFGKALKKVTGLS